jgi:hypothetical protein
MYWDNDGAVRSWLPSTGDAIKGMVLLGTTGRVSARVDVT